MAIPLSVHGREVNSVFELLGKAENDITYSVAWALARSESFREALLKKLFPPARGLQLTGISLQEYAKGCGITDIELRGPEVHVIVEAKRGWTLPVIGQLRKYLPRFDETAAPRRLLVAMSECLAEYATLHLPERVEGVSVMHLSWRDVQNISRVKDGTHAEKRLLRQLRVYLERVVKMQNQESNWVYVVSLSKGKPKWSKLSWIEFVTERRRYFHPAAKNWPKEPPNYVAFRYDGKLQSIHHVEDWRIVSNMHADIPEVAPCPWEPHFLYTLGDPIFAAKEVRTGKIYRSGRKWAMLDLLLTCDTISEASEKSYARMEEAQ